MHECEFCEPGKFPFKISYQGGQIILATTEHRSDFTEDEVAMIKKIFMFRNIRWPKSDLQLHAYCYIK